MTLAPSGSKVLQAPPKPAKPPVTLHFFDPRTTAVFQYLETQKSAAETEGYIQINDREVRQIHNWHSKGRKIALNEKGRPEAYDQPIKPITKWNQRAELMPVTSIDGKITNAYQVLELSNEEILAKLAEIRYKKITTFSVTVNDILFTRENDLAAILSKIEYMRATETKTINWKSPTTGLWSNFTVEDLSGIVIAMEANVQLNYDIEKQYSDTIRAGEPINFMEWKLREV